MCSSDLGDAEGRHSVSGGGARIGAGGEQGLCFAEIGKGVVKRRIAAGIYGFSVGLVTEQQINHRRVGGDDGVMQGRRAVGAWGVRQVGELGDDGLIAVANSVKEVRAGEEADGKE